MSTDEYLDSKAGFCFDGAMAQNDPSRLLPPRLFIVWHSRTGGSESLARAAATAACEETGVAVTLLGAQDVEPSAIIAASALLFVGPENLASLSGAMKEMFDRCYYPCLGKIEGRGYATIICAGSDGENAQRQIDRIATGWRLRRIAEPLIIITGAQTAEDIAKQKKIPQSDLSLARTLAQAVAAGLAMGLF